MGVRVSALLGSLMLPGAALAAIGFDNVTNSGQSLVPSIVWNHVVNDNTSGIVVVGAELRGDAGTNTSVTGTYGGAPLIPIRTETNGAMFGAISWMGYVTAPLC